MGDAAVDSIERRSGALPPSDSGPAIALDVLTVALALGLWFSVGSFGLALVGGFGEHPARRIAIGASLIAVYACATTCRRAVAQVLRVRPWLIALPACAFQLAASLDAPVGGPYTALTLSVLFVAAIVARPRVVWMIVLLLATIHSALAVSIGDAGDLSGREAGGILGHLVALPLGAALFLGFVVLLRRTMAKAPETILDFRRRAETALGPLGLEPGPNPTATFTRAERRVLVGLGAGHTPKQVASAQGVARSTVQTHLRNMKRKSGARTVAELVGLAVAFGAASTETADV